MLRTNLSTRPFYNERIVHVLLGLAAVVVVLLTAYNAIRIVALSRQNTELSGLITRDRGEAGRLTEEAQRIRAGINQEELKATAAAADGANRLIDQRTFSWTQFFNRIEDTLPPDVMLTAVQPSFENDRSVVRMTVLARRTEDVDEFVEKLEATGAFGEVLPVTEDRTEEGLSRVLLQSTYSAAAAEKPESASAAGAPPRGGRARQNPAAPAGRQR
jgi:Tfp pilus assembly protein PilN